jgi:hypothetical protein
MHKTIWTRKMLATLRRLYPTTPAGDIGDLLGLSAPTVLKKAHELGLERDRFKLSKAYYGRYSRNKEGDTKKARS